MRPFHVSRLQFLTKTQSVHSETHGKLALGQSGGGGLSFTPSCYSEVWRKLCENTYKQFWSDYESGRFEEPKSWKATFFVRLFRSRLALSVADLDPTYNRNCGSKRPRNSDNWVPNYEAKGSNTKSVEKRKRSSILDFCPHRSDNAPRPVSPCPADRTF